MAKTKETIRDFYGKILGYIETDSVTGNKVATNFLGKILGYYYKKTNTTTNFLGKILGRGDLTSGLIYSESQKK